MILEEAHVILAHSVLQLLLLLRLQFPWRIDSPAEARMFEWKAKQV